MSDTTYTLIHTALYPEAKPLIRYFDLKPYHHTHFKIFISEKIVLIVSGMGKQKTQQALTYAFSEFNIIKALNIGIAGCKDERVALGSLFCTNQKLTSIPYATLCSVDQPHTNKESLETLLVDMEASAFEAICTQHIKQKDIFIFKVVSDHLDSTIPKKDFVYNTLFKSITKWTRYIGL